MNEGVCKYVTIIQEAILEIKVFLVIFAAGLLGFAVAILHLMHGRYPMGNFVPNVDDVGTKYPHNFLGAVSATYFFMVRREAVLGMVLLILIITSVRCDPFDANQFFFFWNRVVYTTL